MKTSKESLHLEENANSIQLLDANEKNVAELINDEDLCITQSMRQYANLFVAAPDMLAALQRAIAFIGETQEYKTGHTGAVSIVRYGATVVRLAEGK